MFMQLASMVGAVFVKQLLENGWKIYLIIRFSVYSLELELSFISS